MKYAELKNEIRDLGFEDDATTMEYLDIFNSAITRACRLIATLVKAPIGTIRLDLESLGRTTTYIEDGSTVSEIEIDGEMVTPINGNIVTYWQGDKEKKYAFVNATWQELGRYDLDAMSKDERGNVRFDGIDRIVDNTGNAKTFLRYDVEQDHILYINPSIRGDFTIFYKERILPITESTPDDYDIQVVYPCEPLVALLAAHYIWLDDDERKAVMYWNEFDQLRQEIEAKAFKLKARIVGGI